MLLLTLLTAVGGLALAAKSQTLRSSVSLSGAVRVNAELEQSRQALISYAAYYPYLYGPKGAGVGHLPCPDTDSLHSDAANWSLNQGPNPPCGSRPTAVGYLPRHISFPEQRYMIHAGFDHRVDYAVSARVINNPGRHPVNPELSSVSPAALQHAVLLRQHLSSGRSNRIQSSEVMLTNKALMFAVRPSVAAWLIEKLDNIGRFVCADSQSLLLTGELIEIGERCSQIGKLLKRCRAEENPSKTWESTSAIFHSNLLLLNLADDISGHFQCSASVITQIYIDYVPAKKHWLIRNGWLDWVRVEYDAPCVTAEAISCRPTYVNQRSHDALHKPLILRWVLES